MQRQEILDGIREVARIHLGWDGVLTPELRLVEDLGLDSLKSLTLALEVENRFRIALDEAGEIVTIGDLVDAILERVDV
jgi:acyl carrier protein